MQQTSPAPAPPARWTREHLWPGAALLLVAAVAWGLTLHSAQSASMDEMAMPGGVVMFLLGWTVMMVAMMLPATLPVLLLYRTVGLRGLHAGQAAAGMGALLGGYVSIWTVAGLPVYGYSHLAADAGLATAVLPGLLLVAGGAYQFTAFKQACHSRCSNPLFFVTRHWRPGLPGAFRIGVLHGLDCLGCCAGLMAALVALGMMNVAWMLTGAVIIYVEKTFAGGHRVARPIGFVLLAGGVLMLAAAALGSRMPAM